MSKLYGEAEKFIKETYWTESHDKSELSLTNLIYAKVREDVLGKDPDYYNHRPGIVHASSLTSCLRGQALKLLGAKPDREPEDRKLGVFWIGSRFEDILIEGLGAAVTGKQTEYNYPYKSLTLVGRSDFRINDNGIERIGEIKTVHSDSFWYRAKEGNVVAWNNLVQLQIYLWLERMLFKKEPQGVFLYASKDDATLEQAHIKFNQRIIDEVVIPALDYLNAAYEAKNADICPVPPMVIYSEAKGQWQKNWQATYCDFHQQCCGKGWILEAQDEVARKNKELKESNKEYVSHLIKREKPTITPI